MTVAEALTAAGITPAETYTGPETADDYILAIQTDATKQTKPSDYVVCANHVKGAPASLNPTTTDNTYLRSGTSTTKTGAQRTFSIEADRYVGDDFQDYCLSHAVKFGTGADCEVLYVFFSARTGKGEQGTVAICVNEDASGNAGENAGVSIDLKAVSTPTAYTYSAT